MLGKVIKSERLKIRSIDKNCFPRPGHNYIASYAIGYWKTYHLHTSDKQNDYKYFIKVEYNRNTFDLFVGLSYKTVKLGILFISNIAILCTVSIRIHC